MLLLISVADYASADCELTLMGHDRTLAVGPSNANKCGGEMMPWRLTVDDGQQVNISLIQFIVSDEDNDELDSTAVSEHDHYDTQLPAVLARSIYQSTW